MSYRVIARKWRPNNFSELIGQDHVSQTLLNALKTDRLPHALLFTGLRGTGKTSSARILAKALRCPNAKDFVPCNTCADCEDISNGRSPNVSEIDGASNNGVDAIRDLLDNVAYMPSTGTYKLYIIDEVHMLTTSAFNALLKTLEEPPAHVIFVLATTEAHKIPNTILSRCQRFDFRRIPTKQMTDSLSAICKKENVKASDEALWLISRQGEGSLRDSQSLLDQVITFCEGDITLEKVVSVLGLTDRGLIVNTVKALVERDAKTMLDISTKIITSGSDPKIFVQDLLEEIRNLLMVKVAPEQAEDIVDVPGSEIERLTTLGESLSEEDIHLLFDMALKGANDIPRAQDAKVVLEMLLMRMASAPRIMTLTQMGANRPVAANTAPVATTQTATAQTPTQQRAAAPTTSAPQQLVSQLPANDSLEAKWSDLVDRIKKVNRVLAAKLEHSYLVEVKNNLVTIGIPAKMKFLSGQMNESDFQTKLKNYMKTFWGTPYNLEIRQEQEETKKKVLTPKAVETQRKQEHKEAVRKEVEDHPSVKSASEIFKSRIVSIEEQNETRSKQ